MSKITTELAQRMHEAAETTLQLYGNEWFESGTQVHTVHKSKINHISLSSPTNVLALLDENRQLLREKNALEAVALALRDEMWKSEEKLEAAEKRIAELTTERDEIRKRFKLERSILEDADSDLAELRQHIAKLEATTVRIPYLPADCDRTEAHFKYQAAITAAGIKVEGE